MAENYPKIYGEFFSGINELSGLAPRTIESFLQLHEGACESSAPDSKLRELIALGIGIAVRSDGCIAAHTHDALAAGASDKEIMTAIEVAILMGGGPAATGATHALDALKQFKRDSAGSGST
jgi:AhpD family alkylhydroperoxidase